MTRRLLILATALCVIASALGQPSGGPPAANVVVDAARLQLIEPRREVTGELRAIRRSIIASKQPGLVVQVAVEEGDAVKTGATLVRLDDTLERLAVERSRSELQSAQAIHEARTAQLTRAQRDLDSVRSLGDSASEKEILDARSDVIIAEAQLAGANADTLGAQADLESAEQRLEDMVIAAPFAGVVTKKHTEVGQWIGVGDDIVELVDNSVVDAWLNVPEKLLARLQIDGVDAQVRLVATGDVFSAPVSAIVPQADSLSRLFPVRVRLKNTDGRLRPGMSIVGLAPTGTMKDLLTIHKDALRRDDAGAFVFFSAGGSAAAARVRVLFAAGDRLAIQSPTLKPGMEVVIEGNERLYPGQPLHVVNGPPTSARALSSRGG